MIRQIGPALYIVATPIGNLGDITLRAIETLKQADVVAAEDTRVAKRLLGHHGISARLISCHMHNEKRAAEKILSLLRQGRSVALVTDAGTPLLSDPGAELIERVREAGFSVIPVPGPSALACALSAAGLKGGRFFFQGFLPAKGSDRTRAIKMVSSLKVPVILYEAPHRIRRTLKDLIAAMSDRRLFLAREMTKVHEEYRWTTLEALAQEMEQHEPRGEFTLIVMPKQEESDQGQGQEIPDELVSLLKLLSSPEKTGLKRLSTALARATGQPAASIYNQMVQIRRRQEGQER